MLDDLGNTFFGEDGTVRVVDNATERPAVDHACINVTAVEEVTVTMLLPIHSMMADQPTDLGTVAKIGVALEGTPIFADAQSVMQTGHMPALDTCGGHVDPGGWYHWHATSTDIEETTLSMALQCMAAPKPMARRRPVWMLAGACWRHAPW